jgi:hypothetical protein
LYFFWPIFRTHKILVRHFIFLRTELYECQLSITDTHITHLLEALTLHFVQKSLAFVSDLEHTNFRKNNSVFFQRDPVFDLADDGYVNHSLEALECKPTITKQVTMWLYLKECITMFRLKITTISNHGCKDNVCVIYVNIS